MKYFRPRASPRSHKDSGVHLIHGPRLAPLMQPSIRIRRRYGLSPPRRERSLHNSSHKPRELRKKRYDKGWRKIFSFHILSRGKIFRSPRVAYWCFNENSRPCCRCCRRRRRNMWRISKRLFALFDLLVYLVLAPANRRVEGSKNVEFSLLDFSHNYYFKTAGLINYSKLLGQDGYKISPSKQSQRTGQKSFSSKPLPRQVQ